MRDRKNVIAVKFTDRENMRLRREADRLETTMAQLIRHNLAHIIGENWVTAEADYRASQDNQSLKPLID